MRTIIKTTVEIDSSGRMRITGGELYPTSPGDPHDPVELTDGCTLAYVQGDPLGPAVIISDEEGGRLCVLGVERPGAYHIEIVEDDDRGFIQVTVKAPTKIPALA